MTSLLNVLPAELLIEILKYIDAKTLLRCSQTCKSLHNITSSTAELQYHIELAAEGLVDGVDCPLSPAERLRLLRARRARWRRLDWQAVARVDVSGTCQAYELVAGVFALSKGPRHLSLTTLPTHDAPPAQRERVDVGFLTRDFAIDPSQDLVAFVELLILDKIVVQLRTMQDNRPHPLARRPTLEMLVSDAVSSVNFIQIVDDVVGVFFLAHGPCFVVWNWRTGRQVVNCSNLQMPLGAYDVSFLSSRTYMITIADGSGSIELYTFDAEPDIEETAPRSPPTSPHAPLQPAAPPQLYDASNPLPAQPRKAAVLWLPTTHLGQELRRISTHSAPFVARDTPGRPFSAARGVCVHAMELRYGMAGKMFNMFVLNRFLLGLATAGANAGAGDAPVVRQWEEWGPDNTRLFPQVAHFQWLRYVHGSRIVFPPLAVSSPPEAHILMVLDFNVHLGRGGEEDADYKPDAAAYQLEDVPQRARIVAAADAVPDEDLPVFTGPVTTRLPYRCSTRTDVKDLDRYSGFMIDEDRLIGLRGMDMLESDISLDVFMF